MKQNLNRRSKHLVHVTVGWEIYEVKVVMEKCDFHWLETDNTFYHSNADVVADADVNIGKERVGLGGVRGYADVCVELHYGRGQHH